MKIDISRRLNDALSIARTLFVIGALFVGSCASDSPAQSPPAPQPPPPPPGQRLIGTWQQDMSLNPEFFESMNELRAKLGQPPIEDRQQFMREMEAAMAADPEGGRPMRVAFETDGDYIMQGWILGHFLEEHASWKVLEESPEQITIGLRDPKRSEDEAVTYVFVEPDVIRQDTKIGPMYMRRVHD